MARAKNPVTLPEANNHPEAGASSTTPASARYALSRVTDPAAWDALMLRSGSAGVLQSWRWGEFKRDSGWSPTRLVLSASPSNGDTAEPLICAQLLVRSVPRLPVPVSVAYIPRGPVYFSNDEGVARAFWQAVHTEARKQGAIFLKVEPNVELSDDCPKGEIDSLMSRHGFRPAGRLQPARTIVLDLDKSEDDLLKAMKPKTRYNLRLAGRRGVQVRPAATPGDLESFYSLLTVTGERDEFGIHTFDYYKRLWEIFGPDGDGTLLILLADHPDEAQRAEGPIAALLAMRFGPEAVYMYGASANRGREHMPTYLLQWEAVRWAKGHDCCIYDFWGIPDPPSEDAGDDEVSPINTRSGLRGVYWFKKGFAGREIDYPGAYDYVYNPLLYKLWMRWRGSDLG